MKKLPQSGFVEKPQTIFIAKSLPPTKTSNLEVENMIPLVIVSIYYYIFDSILPYLHLLAFKDRDINFLLPNSTLDTARSAPRSVQEKVPTNLYTDYLDDELGHNFDQIQAEYNLDEQSLMLLEAQDAVTEARPFSTAHAFIEFYATRMDRLWNRDESRRLPKDSSQPPDAFDVPCKFALMYPQSEDTCKFHHWSGYKRFTHEQRCRVYNLAGFC